MSPPDPEASFLARLLELPAAEREAFLQRACAEDSRLAPRLAEITRALAHVGAATPRVEPDLAEGLMASRAVARGFEAALHIADGENSGTKIGPYKLLQKIGEGGFGVVWMAEQQEPIKRRVALKIIKIGMDTEEVVARFEAERQALALMEHPNIARVFDAGATEAGRLFFVMELVRGVAITRYCDENRLPAGARLRLFITVCQAVQHAHQKGVIHRDLKPSNILVTLHDGVPVPVIIDFGIAKATSTRLTERTLFTQFHAFIGTPAYTSPEQMEMSGLDIDTRSDIYSLGVLLYELLTSQPPFDSDALLKSGLEAMRRTIREIDPPRPSRRFGTLSEINRTSVAHQRNTEPARLSLLLRGDLDWIVMRCLEKDRTRRYDSATALATDIERHLRDHVVEARPPSQTYRARKFVRRHQLAVFAVAAVAVSLIAGLIASSTLLVRERSAHDRATIAERKEASLRRQAEIARAEEEKRAARTSLELANRNLSDGRVADGLAYLVYAARKDPLNPVLAPRLASVLASHDFLLPEGAAFECGSRVMALRYSIDGRTFMVGTEDGTLRVFEAATGKILHKFPLGKTVQLAGGWLFARANDGIFAARFQDNSLAVYDAATGRQLGTSIQLDPTVLPRARHVRLSADGRWVCSDGYRKLWLWDALTGEKRFEHEFERGNVQDFDFSPDGRLLSVVSGDVVRLWSVPDCVPVFTPVTVEDRLADQKNHISLFARFLPDSRRLAVLDPFTGIRIYDATTGAMVGPLIAAAGGFSREDWELSPDGRLLHANEKGTEIRDLETGQVTNLPVPSRQGNWEKNFNRDGSLLLSTANDDLARLWDTTTGKAAGEFTLQLHTSIRGALSPDGTQIVVGTVQGGVYRLRSGRGIARPLVLPRLFPARPVAFLPEGPARLLWLTTDRARVLDVTSGRDVAGGFDLPRRLTEAAPGEGSPGKSPIRADLRFLVVRNGPGWEAWEFSPGRETKVAPLRDDPPAAGTVTFSPAGDLVAIAHASKIRVWNLRSGACVGPPIEDGQRILWWESVNFSPDGRRLAAGFLGGTAAIWDVATGTPMNNTFEPSPDVPLIGVQFNPEGTRIATADRNGEARLWEAATGAPLSPVLYHASGLRTVSFTPDGGYFVTRSQSEARVWEVRTTTLVGVPIALPDGRSLRFSRDSRRFVTASEDPNARVFDVRTAQLVTEPMNHGNTRLPSASFSPDGLYVLTGTTAPDVRVWSVPPALPDGTPPPEWLLQLSTACAGKVVNGQGQLTAVNDSAAVDSLRAQIAALPADAPLAEWGRWILNDRADRSIAPGFTITPEQAAKLTASLAMVAAPSSP